MNLRQYSFTELVDTAARLDLPDYERFIASVNRMRAKNQPGKISSEESDLLKKINRGFLTKRWLRMQELDAKMEDNELTEQEYAELTLLTDAYEKYAVQRIRLLKRLALLRNTSLEKIMNQLGLQHGEV